MEQKCPFCQIIKGEKESKKVYEDQNVLAILDIRPSAPGHTLVIPKEHAPTLQNLSSKILSSLFSGVREVMRRIEGGLNPDGFNVGWNHGKVAGQAVPHLHVHVVPRYEGDEGGPVQAVVRNEPDEELSSIAERISGGEKPPMQRGRVGKEAIQRENQEKGESSSPQKERLKEAQAVTQVASEEESCDEEKDEENEEDEKEEENEKNKSAKKKWKEMKKPKY